MPEFAVAWLGDYPPEFGGGKGMVVSAEKCRDAEKVRDRAIRDVARLREDVAWLVDWMRQAGEMPTPGVDTDEERTRWLEISSGVDGWRDAQAAASTQVSD